MRVGIPREIKNREYRVSATPDCVRAYRRAGHEVLVQRGAGVGAGFEDAAYEQAGASLIADARSVWSAADMIVKVKEPLREEYELLRPGQLLFTYLHLAAVPELAEALMQKQITAVAYETIELPDGSLPCLTPMSAIAGRLAVQEGAKYLEKPYGGRGVLLGGVPGVQRGRVVILGGGVVGTHAAKMAVGLGADVTLLELSHKRLNELDDLFDGRVQTLVSNEANLTRAIAQADLVIGAVLVTGARAPKLIRREHLSQMLPGSLIAHDPLYTSMFVANLGSVGIEAAFHHLYEWGNCPFFAALGKTREVATTQGPRQVVLVRYSFDERIDDGLSCAHGLELVKQRVEHPEQFNQWPRSAVRAA